MPTYKENYQCQQWLFVGEQRSPKAKQMGVTWEDMRLCSKTLREALQACGVKGAFLFVNLWDDAGTFQMRMPKFLKNEHRKGWVIIGLGQKVQRCLEECGVPHVPMIHPAARGAGRARAVYKAHVREVMSKAGALLPAHTT